MGACCWCVACLCQTECVSGIVVWVSWWSWGSCRKRVEAAEFAGVWWCVCMVLVCGLPVPDGVCERDCGLGELVELGEL